MEIGPKPHSFSFNTIFLLQLYHEIHAEHECVKSSQQTDDGIRTQTEEQSLIPPQGCSFVFFLPEDD